MTVLMKGQTKPGWEFVLHGVCQSGPCASDSPDNAM